MKKIASLSLALCLLIGAIANAQDTRMTPGIQTSDKGMKSNNGIGSVSDDESCQDGEGCQDGKSCDSCSGEDCPVMVSAMETLPKLVFRIGEEETCCHMTATQMARETETPIVYIVGKKKFSNPEIAFTSLVKQTESHVSKFITPKVCSESGCTTLAGKSCDCPDAAAKITELVNSATKDQVITYTVGKESFKNYNVALKRAKKTHQKGMFSVGDETFESEMEARLALAHNKFRSAVSATMSKDNASSDKATSNEPAAANEPAKKKLAKTTPQREIE